MSPHREVTLFDFAGISQAAATLETGVRDIDSRLSSIETMLRILIVLTAMQVANDDEDDEEIKHLIADAADFKPFSPPSI